jgi:hypothetical protein
MALNFAHGSIQWLTSDALSSTKVISGLGFAPKALRFYWVGLQSNSPTNAVSQTVSIRRGVGVAVSSTERRCVGSYSLDVAASSDCGSVAANNSVVITVNGSGVIDGLLDISSFDSDGFTLIVDDVAPVNITVFYEAWGGSDITVASVGDIAEPAAIGTQNYTVNGFTAGGGNNQVVMFAGVQSTAALNTGQANDSGLCVGFASSTSTANNVTICGNSDDASATMDTDGYIRNTECLSMIVVAGGNATARATLSAWNNNSFTLNWLARATANRRYVFLAIKGGFWRAGAGTINGNTLNATSTIGPLPFNPIGVSLFTRNAIRNATAGTSSTENLICLGSASSTTSRNSAGSRDVNGLADSNTPLILQYDSVLSVPSTTGTVLATYDVNSFTNNSIGLIVDTAGGVANTYYGYLAFGSQMPPVPISVGHPFII